MSDATFDKLRVFKDLSGKDSNQWQLIHYYRELPVWSKKVEQAAWADKNLSVLKARATDWLFKAMVRIGGWYNQDIYFLLEAVTWGVHTVVDQTLLDMVDEAKELAWSREAYALFEEALRLEYMLVHKIGNEGERRKRTQGLLDARQMLTQRRNDIDLLLSIRLTHFEQARQTTIARGSAHPEDFHALAEALDQINYQSLSAGEAMLNYHALRLACQSILKEVSKAW